MAEESSTTSQLSVATTETGMTQVTGENTVTSSSPRGVEFYFECAVLVIGVVGTATNGLILYALVASKQHKKHLLIVNQNVLDLFGSFFLIIAYSLKLCNIYLTGSVGYWLCIVVLSESLWLCAITSSIINLAIVTIDRYLKVVHAVWSKNKLRKWVIYSAMAFVWIISVIYIAALVFPTTAVMNGACYAYAFWKNKTAQVAHVVLYFVFFYVITLLIFIFCYWRILLVIRRQAKVMASHNAAGPGTAPTQAQILSHKMQSNVIKTMISVSALYAILWLPYNVYVLLLSLNPNPTVPGNGYYASVFIAFLYICINPFIYAIKFDPVKERLLRIIHCNKTTGQVIAVTPAPAEGTPGRTGTSRRSN